MKKTLALGTVLIIFLAFQNCSEVGFTPLSTSQLDSKQSIDDLADDFANDFEQDSPHDPKDHSKEEAKDDSCRDDVDETVVDDQDEILDEVVAKNSACDAIFDSSFAMDLKGQDFSKNGIADSLHLKNGNVIRIHGAIDEFSVNGSNELHSNGIHRVLCLKSKEFNLHGAYGFSGIPVVLIGQGSRAKIKSLNGILGSDLILINIHEAGSINSLSGDMYIYGGHVDSINGGGRDLHLMNGVKVDRIHGIYRNIYIYEGSSIKRLHGISKLIKVKSN